MLYIFLQQLLLIQLLKCRVWREKSHMNLVYGLRFYFESGYNQRELSAKAEGKDYPLSNLTSLLFNDFAATLL